MNRIFEFAKKRKLIFVAIIMLIVAVVLDPNFINPFNLNGLLVDIAIIGLLSTGQMLVMLTGGIDISIGNIASAASVFVAFMMIQLQNIAPWMNMTISIIFALLFCGLLGALNGIGVVILKLPPLISTLCGMWIAKGLAYFFLNGVATPFKVRSFTSIARLHIFNIPYAFIFLILIVLLVYYFLNNFRVGRAIYAVGGNEYAANISGIKKDKVKIWVYIVSGLFGAVGGMILGAYTGTGYVKGAGNYELYAIAAAAIGGVSLNGGVGDAWNVLLGVFIFRILSKIMIFANLANQLEGVYIGAALIIAMTLSSYQKKSSKKVAQKNNSLNSKV